MLVMEHPLTVVQECCWSARLRSKRQRYQNRFLHAVLPWTPTHRGRRDFSQLWTAVRSLGREWIWKGLISRRCRALIVHDVTVNLPSIDGGARH